MNFRTLIAFDTSYKGMLVEKQILNLCFLGHPILYIWQTYEHIDILHVISDGPTTLYQNRYNFFLASVVPGLLGFHRTWWNFSEAGHGKAAVELMLQ